MVESRFDDNLNTNNINTLNQENYRDEFGRTVKAFKQEGAIGYLAFNAIIKELFTGIVFDRVTSCLNGNDTEILSFISSNEVLREIQIVYGIDTWEMTEYNGSILQESSTEDFITLEDGGLLLFEG